MYGSLGRTVTDEQLAPKRPMSNCCIPYIKLRRMLATLLLVSRAPGRLARTSNVVREWFAYASSWGQSRVKRAAFARTAGAGAVAARGLRSRYAAAATARVPLRVGTTPIDASATPYYAQALGFYEQAGLDVQVTTGTNGGSPLLAAMLGGQLDICITSTAALTYLSPSEWRLQQTQIIA